MKIKKDPFAADVNKASLVIMKNWFHIQILKERGRWNNDDIGIFLVLHQGIDPSDIIAE